MLLYCCLGAITGRYNNVQQERGGQIEGTNALGLPTRLVVTHLDYVGLPRTTKVAEENDYEGQRVSNN